MNYGQRRNKKGRESRKRKWRLIFGRPGFTLGDMREAQLLTIALFGGYTDRVWQKRTDYLNKKRL